MSRARAGETAMSFFKTTLLLGLMTGLLMAIGGLLSLEWFTRKMLRLA